MLSSIHPFGERSRNNSFGQTAAAHIVGSTLGGTAFGALFGTIGLLVSAIFAPSARSSLGIVLAVTIAAFLIEATRRERLLPTRSRQVDENWIQTYRGWVYGGGWGAELGFGISTIISTALVHVLAVVMIFVALPVSLLLGAIFGFVRGATILVAINVDTPERLRQLHQRLDKMRSTSRSGVLITLIAAMAIGVGAVL